MKNALLCLLVLVFFLSCHSQPSSPAILGPEDFEKNISTGGEIQILDVRTAGEFKSGHIKNAMQADWTNQQQFKERVSFMDKNKPVYTYCLVGARSHEAAVWLRSNGFKQVVELRGGINAWKRQNKPVEGSGNEPQLTMEVYYASIQKDKTVQVDFGASWCPPCVKMSQVLADLEKTAGNKFVLLKIDAGIHTNIMNELKLEPIPVFIIYKNGKEVWRKQGLVSKEEFLSRL